LGNDFLCIFPTLEGWVYRVSYTWASMGYTGHMGHSHIYTLTYGLFCFVTFQFIFFTQSPVTEKLLDL
jgi:hypothetical protein